MPMPRKPTKLKQLQGTAQPCRMNPDEPEPVPVNLPSIPPEDLTPEEKRAWIEISERIAPGVVTVADLHLVEIVARQIAKDRSGTITGWGMSCLMRGLSQLGMTPADRSKISVKKPEKKSKWLK